MNATFSKTRQRMLARAAAQERKARRERLNKAAPDLLAASVAFIEYAHRREDWGHHWTCDIKQARNRKCSCGWGGVLETVRAAITKAEGQS